MDEEEHVEQPPSFDGSGYRVVTTSTKGRSQSAVLKTMQASRTGTAKGMKNAAIGRTRFRGKDLDGNKSQWAYTKVTSDKYLTKDQWGNEEVAWGEIYAYGYEYSKTIVPIQQAESIGHGDSA